MVLHFGLGPAYWNELENQPIAVIDELVPLDSRGVSCYKV